LLKNISVLDTLTLYPRYLRKRALDLLVIKRIFKNWPIVLLFRFGFLRHIALEFRNGTTTVRIRSQEEYKKFWDSKEGQYTLARYYGYDNRILIQSKIVKLKFDDKIIKFSYTDDDEQLRNIFGTIKENFIDEQFKNLDVKGKDVVDIGANIGDSAIYFALKGAKHVYAFEPYHYSYEIAKRNIKLNNLEDRITLLSKGCGKTGLITISTGANAIVVKKGFLCPGSYAMSQGNLRYILVSAKTVQEVVKELPKAAIKDELSFEMYEEAE